MACPLRREERDIHAIRDRPREWPGASYDELRCRPRRAHVAPRTEHRLSDSKCALARQRRGGAESAERRVTRSEMRTVAPTKKMITSRLTTLPTRRRCA